MIETKIEEITKAELNWVIIQKNNIIDQLEKDNAEQKAQIEKMKCCGNCKHCYLWEDFYINMNCSLPNTNIDLGNKCDKWELAE